MSCECVDVIMPKTGKRREDEECVRYPEGAAWLRLSEVPTPQGVLVETGFKLETIVEVHPQKPFCYAPFNALLLPHTSPLCARGAHVTRLHGSTA